MSDSKLMQSSPMNVWLPSDEGLFRATVGLDKVSVWPEPGCHAVRISRNGAEIITLRLPQAAAQHLGALLQRPLPIAAPLDPRATEATDRDGGTHVG